MYKWMKSQCKNLHKQKKENIKINTNLPSHYISGISEMDFDETNSSM